MGSITPEELIKLCDKAEGDHLAGRPCPECDARDELYEDFGFSSPARARSYAALWEALEASHANVWGCEHECSEDGGPNFDDCKALAITEEES